MDKSLAVIERAVAQNIYDDPEVFAAYCALPRSVEGLDGAPEWPAMRAILPDLRDRKVIDLGCGLGAFCRWARSQGAAQVVGLDISENMLERAWEEEALGISFALADIEDLRMPQAEFDLVYSGLVFHYIEDIAPIYRLMHRALVPGGKFVFSVEHPNEDRRTPDWLAPGAVKYHRSVETTLNQLAEAGFTLDRVEEFAPTESPTAQDPALTETHAGPMFLLVSALR